MGVHPSKVCSSSNLIYKYSCNSCKKKKKNQGNQRNIFLENVVHVVYIGSHYSFAEPEWLSTTWKLLNTKNRNWRSAGKGRYFCTCRIPSWKLLSLAVSLGWIAGNCLQPSYIILTHALCPPFCKMLQVHAVYLLWLSKCSTLFPHDSDRIYSIGKIVTPQRRICIKVERHTRPL